VRINGASESYHKAQRMLTFKIISTVRCKGLSPDESEHEVLWSSGRLSHRIDRKGIATFRKNQLPPFLFSPEDGGRFLIETCVCIRWSSGFISQGDINYVIIRHIHCPNLVKDSWLYECQSRLRTTLRQGYCRQNTVRDAYIDAASWGDVQFFAC
jgi:hypothetical protein